MRNILCACRFSRGMNEPSESEAHQRHPAYPPTPRILSSPTARKAVNVLLLKLIVYHQDKRVTSSLLVSVGARIASVRERDEELGRTHRSS